MEMMIFETAEKLAARVADTLYRLLQAQPQAVLCLASGHSPRRSYQLLVEKLHQSPLPLQQIRIVGLDEWLGIAPENPGSCRYFFEQELVAPLQLNPQQVLFFDGRCLDAEAECERVFTQLESWGGIDLTLLGVGVNGHIGFNEPGTSWELNCHCIPLTETTRQIGQKYFETTTVLDKGLTLGIRPIRQSRNLLMLATGSHKADIIEQLLNGPIGESCPATVLRLHANGYLLVDRPAAAQIQAQDQ